MNRNRRFHRLTQIKKKRYSLVHQSDDSVPSVFSVVITLRERRR